MTSTKKCPTRGCKRFCDFTAKACIVCTRKRLRAEATARHALRPEVALEEQRQESRLAGELRTTKMLLKTAVAKVDQQERELQAVAELKRGLDVFTIKPSVPSRGNEATAVIVASDWHYAGHVDKAMVGGLNEFNLAIAHTRIEKFFQKALRLTNLLAADIKVPTMVLALLGDFITNHIHEEFMETNELTPTLELVAVQNEIASGIQFLLDNSTRKLIIPCHSGNHARTTKTTHFGAENGHSLEYLMYLHLQAYFRKEPRVTFIVPEGPHSYLELYPGQPGATTIRFQHGHMVKYGGGVGGLTIPLLKKIAKWNQGKHADLDVLGHFHQLLDGGNFVVNGSLIGYDSFALSIGASFEKPRQAMFLVDRKRGRTFNCPILL